jgi:hypothetical protein
VYADLYISNNKGWYIKAKKRGEEEDGSFLLLL